MKKLTLLIFYLLFTVNFIYCQNSNQNIKLSQGWNIFSTYIQPISENINSVLQPVISNVIIVKDGGGNVYWPQYNVNNIGNMDIGEGYQVKMLSTINLAVIGIQIIPENTPIYIPIGWSMLGYLRIWPQNIDTALVNINNNISLIKDDLGNTYWPEYGINQINYLIPGKGYQIKMLNADTLIYSANTFTCGTDVISDYDFNIYNTVQIGNQCWIKENIKTTFYADGVPLVDGTSAGSISGNYTTKLWFVYSNNLSNKATYGLLYTWAAIMNDAEGSNSNPSGIQGVCPSGWHVSSDSEWQQMEIFIGMSQSQANEFGYRGTIEGGRLKESGTLHWTSPNVGADNSSGFTALPGGSRNVAGSFYDYHDLGFWWQTTENSESPDSSARYRILGFYNSSVYRANQDKSNGFSVRCIKDTTTQASIPSITTNTVSSITQTTTAGGGVVSSDGGVPVNARGVCWNTTGNPTISDSHTIDGSGLGLFTSNLTGLTASTYYYVRAYATNSIGTAYGNQISFTTLAWGISCPGISTVLDYDGNIYNTVQIGTQCWMRENLKTTHYSDGTSLIDGYNAGNIWGNYFTQYWFVYNNISSYKNFYGLLYTWAAVMKGSSSSDANPSGVQGVCPSGWHVPSDSEWKQMEMFLGMSQSQADAEGYRGTDEGGKLKYSFATPNNGASNSSGFTAVGAGYRDENVFSNIFYFNLLYTSTQSSSIYAIHRGLTYDHTDIFRFSIYKHFGLSVRCLKD
jgi:uncharacterized protein (TIGR02145 family)